MSLHIVLLGHVDKGIVMLYTPRGSKLTELVLLTTGSVSACMTNKIVALPKTLFCIRTYVKLRGYEDGNL